MATKPIQYRSNLTAICKELDKLTFTPQHIELMQRTPFWLLINSLLSKQADRTWFKKNDNLIDQILEVFIPETCTFHMKKTNIPFTPRDIKLIFGIRDGNTEIALTQRGGVFFESPIIDRRFPRDESEGRTFLTRKKITTALHQAVMGKKQDDIEDVARLVTLYLLNTLFVPFTSSVTSWSYIDYVADIDAMCSYNWSAHIFQFLINGLSKIETKKGKDVPKSTGCTIAVLVSYKL